MLTVEHTNDSNEINYYCCSFSQLIMACGIWKIFTIAFFCAISLWVWYTHNLEHMPVRQQHKRCWICLRNKLHNTRTNKCKAKPKKQKKNKNKAKGWKKKHVKLRDRWIDCNCRVSNCFASHQCGISRTILAYRSIAIVWH